MTFCGVAGFSCCPGTSDVFNDKGNCERSGKIELGYKCVCHGMGHLIRATCSDGWTGSPCCADSDCAWADNTHTGYCQKNTCIVWEKWPVGHTCSKASDCMTGGCDGKKCYDPDVRPFHDGHSCDKNEDCLGRYCNPYTGPGCDTPE